ncbi:unnamed protein product, partial [Sphenostylis stenocarpa]
SLWKKAQDIQAHNVTPHLLSRGGYRKLEQTMMIEKEKTRYVSSSYALSLDPPSPPSCHEKWKQTRCRRLPKRGGRSDAM